MKKGFIYLGAIITTSLIAVVLAGLMLSLPKNEPIACTMEAKLCPDGSAVGRTGPRCEFAPCPVVDMTKVELEIINNFLTQWPQLQTALEVKPVLGSTTWFVDDIQFIGNNAILVAFEDGHIMPVAVYRYFGNNVFNYEAIYINDFPFSQNNWLSVVSQFGDVNYQASTYTKEVVRGAEIIHYDEWTKVAENKFVKTVDLSNWQTYRNEEYGFEFKYPSEARQGTDDGISFSVRVNDLQATGWEGPLAYDLENALQDKTALAAGDPSTYFGMAVNGSAKMLNIKNALAKELTILIQLDACNVQFNRQAFIYYDHYQIIITWTQNEVEAIKRNNPTYFKGEDCGGGYHDIIWRDSGEAFYNDLINNKTDVVSQYWFDSFDGVINTFKFINSGQCLADSDCKLIYSGCDCEAVPVSDARTYLESDLVCIRNGCMPPTEKMSACLNNKCIKKDK